MLKSSNFSESRSKNSVKLVQQFFIEMINKLHDDDHFLELSREREKNYAMTSTDRWWEILTILANKKRDISKMAVLDIGTSPFTFLLRELSRNVTTIDLTNHLKERCEQAAIEFFKGGIPDSLRLLQDNHFDCIFCLEVIEHLHVNPVKILGKLHKKLKSGGILILSTPNLACLDNRIRLLFNKKLDHFTYPPYDDNPLFVHGHMHDRIFMPPELLDYASTVGFSQSRLRYHVSYPSIEITDYRNPGKLIRYLLRHIIPSLSSHVILIAKK